MNFLRDKRTFFFLRIFFFLLLFFIDPANALIHPPDPFESTDRYALLIPASDGTVTRVQVKIKTSGSESLGSGELRALFRYKLLSSQKKVFHFAVSKGLSVQGLSNTTRTLVEFDFSGEPIPAEAYHRTLLIYYQENPKSAPMLVSEYRPEQLLQKPSEEVVETSLPTQSTAQWGSSLWGPTTFLREREEPKTEQISFTVSDATGPFLLRLTNGTAEGTNRVSGAVVKLNGREIIGPSEFNQNVAEISHQVTLLSGENFLEVRLRSAPGAFVTMGLFRLDKQACHILDIHTFKRSKGKPVVETLAFELKPQFSEPFALYLTNGDSAGGHRVDSAIIRLNGQLVFDPNDFNERVRDLSQVVPLQSKNTLSVEICGAPGDFLALGITGYDDIPPFVRITDPSNGDTLKVSSVAVSGIVDDPSSSLTVNGITTPIASDGSFTLEGITLQEGENIIKAVATDACGNHGEDQRLVYLKTIPEGPKLVLCAEPFRERTPKQLPPDCHDQDFATSTGVISGLTDDTAISITLNDVLLPDEVKISSEGDIYSGMRDGDFFWAFVKIPQVDGTHPFTAVATNAEGGQTEATVTFVRDTVPPKVAVASPIDGLVTKNPEITIRGTVDDPEAVVLLDWWIQIPVEDGGFTTTYTLSKEGLNYLTISARDPAENSSYVSLTVILDTIPPQINVTNPIEGMAVNTPTLNVTGNIIDQNINEVTVTVNGSQPQPLTLTGTNFSGVANLSPGQNTLTFHAVDKAGNSASVTRSVSLDIEVPALTITAPLSGVLIYGMVNVMVEASDSGSGIASVTLYVDGQAQTTLNRPPYNFTLDTSLLASGLHTITVRAIDGVGNQAEASVSITIDNSAPVVSITAPAPGAVVSGWITVLVQASDAISGIAGVSLYVDGLLRATLTQPPFNFPLDTLQFASGSHTITAIGIDTAGNQGEATVVIIFDHEVPSVTITAPASGAMVSGIITVSVDASDSISGIASVTLHVDNQAHSTLNQPPFNFAVDTSGFVPGSHTLTARAVDKVGNQGEANITITVLEPVRVEITSPTNGATINQSNAIVQGRIYNQTGEIGVVVNGVIAEVQGSDFAVIVPLQMGQNTITATATRDDGVQGQTSITINTETQEEFVRLTVTPTSGILDQTGILNVTFEAEAYLVNPVSHYSWDFNGDGAPEITGPEATIVAQYQYPGIYFPRVSVADNHGNIYIETTIINVLSREEMDAILSSKWEGVRSRLSIGDVEGALVFFDEFAKQDYRELFNVLSSMLPTIVQEMSDIQFAEYMDNTVVYDIRTIRDGVEYSFQLLFIQDRNGIWRITSF